MINNGVILNEELNKVNSLMFYDRSLTLNEQGAFDILTRQQFSTRQGAEKYMDDLHQTWDDVLENWDSDVAGWTEIGLTIVGAILTFTPLSPLGVAMVGAGTAIGTADAAVRIGRGDTFGGALILALQFIPGGVLVDIFKQGKNLAKLGKYSDEAKALYDEVMDGGKEALIALDKKISGKTASKVEAEVAEMIMEVGAKQTSKITKEVIKRMVTQIKSSLYTMTLEKGLVMTLPIIRALGIMTLQVGGTAIAVDVIWKLATVEGSVARNIRNESDLGILLDMLYGKAYDFSPELVKKLWNDIWWRLFNEDGTPNYSEQSNIVKMLSGGITEETIENNEVLKQSGIRASEDYLTEIGIKMLSQPSNEVLDSEEVNKTIRSSQPVTPNTIVSGKQTIRQGQKGKVVRQIQTMLVTLGYDLGDSGKNKDGVDGDYGDKTVEAIVDFQFDYDLDGLDGIVGKETMTKLYDLYKEKTISKNEE